MKHTGNKSRNVGQRSKRPTTRKNGYQQKVLVTSHKPQQKRIDRRKSRSIEEAYNSMLTRNLPTFLSGLVTLACLYEFIHSRDAYMLLTAYAMANGNSSLPLVKALLPLQQGVFTRSA